MEAGRPDHRGLGLQIPAGLRVGPGEVEVVHDRPLVQGRTAQEQDAPPARTDPGDRLPGELLVASDAERLGRVRRRRGGGAGPRARCSAVGLAVPTSIPRYTTIESTETISAPRRSATASPASVLPAAVGPTSARSGGSAPEPWPAITRRRPAPAAPRARRPGGAGARPRCERRGTSRARARRRRARRGCPASGRARHPCARAPRSGPRPHEPTCSRIRSSAIASWSATSRSNRSWTTGLASWSSISAARVPGRGEYWNV